MQLTAHYGPLKLASPVIVGACPLTGQELQQIAFVNAGAGAIVLPSLFEEQIFVWNRGYELTLGSRKQIPRRSDLVAADSLIDVDSYLRLAARSNEICSIPVIASLNGGCLHDAWSTIAQRLEESGISAIELHLRRPLPDEFESHQDFELAALNTVDRIKESCSLPLFVKLCRDQASLHSLACRLATAIDGLTLFGRAPHFDIQLDSMKLTAEWGLTQPGSIGESIGSLIQINHYCPEISLSACGGIGCSADLAKALLAGADTAMVTSAIYRDGANAISILLDGLVKYMETQHVTSLAELKAKAWPRFDTELHRFAYLAAGSSNLGRQALQPTVECDRWGHLPGSP